MHFYKFHIGDYMSHTRHLSLMEDLAYRRLLDFYFLHEQPIKHRDAARHIGMRDHEEDVLTVLNEFFLSTENGFINTRADKEIAEFKKHQAISAFGAFVRDNPSLKPFASKEDYVYHYLNGSLSGYLDTLRVDDVHMMGTSSVDDAPLTNNHKPLTNNQREKKATSVVRPPDVSEQVWNDWLQLRKAKKASVTETVLKGARSEANKIGWTLEQFLIEWCTRGSQGLKAEWLKEKLTKSEERQNVMAELTRGKSVPKAPFWAKPETIVLEAQDVERKRLL
jgi:hypothetical protein